MAALRPSSKTLREKLSLWESLSDIKAPLSDTQMDSAADISEMANRRPLPIELPLDDITSVTLTSSTTMIGGGDAISEGLAQLENDLGKVDTTQQFFLWFSKLEDCVETEEEIAYRLYTEHLTDYQGQCDAILDEVGTALGHLENLVKQYVLVSTKTNALHEACEHLMAEQMKLMNSAESIQNKLSYFNELDKISNRLGSTTLSVTSDSFVPTLSRIDECISYLNKNSQFKESDIYLAKFRQCLSKALQLIKQHVTNILQTATQNVLPKEDGTAAGSDNAFTLFYGKFRANAPRVKSLMTQIEQRVETSPEYEQLLADCHQCYFQQRQILLGPSVSAAVTDLANNHRRDHCALMRSGCAFMVHVCEDEYQIFQQFFSEPTPLLDGMLESLCTSLYDVFRPLIIHINHLETLAELCSILKNEMLDEHVSNNPSQLGAFESMCSQMLEDVQERLVYRTYIYIRTDILHYNPAGGDLAYPEKLEMMESIAESMKKNYRPSSLSRSNSDLSLNSQEVASINAGAENGVPSNGSSNGVDHVGSRSSVMTPTTKEPVMGGGNMPMSPADMHGMWYPTVRRTLLCLSKLSRCIDMPTFQGLSQETLSHCVNSLLAASEAIIKRKTVMDGQLFLIKHLLILREQIAPFHVEFSIKETSLDFSKFKDAAMGLIYKRSKLFTMNGTNAVLQFILDGTPQVTEYLVDSKQDVDNQLKKSCEEFIKHATEMCTAPLQQFNKKADVILTMNEEEGAPTVSLRRQPFADPVKVQDVCAETYKLLKTKVPIVQRAMSLYLANRDTEYILFRPVKVHIQQCFQKTLAVVKDEYSVEDALIVACPSVEQINLLLSTTTAKITDKSAATTSTTTS